MYGNPYYAPYQSYFPNNTDYRTNYQNLQNMQQPQSPQMSNFSANDPIYVINENEAVAYPVAPNNSVVLWHKSEPIIFIKSANAQGVPSMRILDYTERSEATQNNTKINENALDSKYVTIQQFTSMRDELAELKAHVQEISARNNEPIVEDKPKNTVKKLKGGNDNV